MTPREHLLPGQSRRLAFIYSRSYAEVDESPGSSLYSKLKPSLHTHVLYSTLLSDHYYYILLQTDEIPYYGFGFAEGLENNMYHASKAHVKQQRR